jgi:hypothetical protein
MNGIMILTYLSNVQESTVIKQKFEDTKWVIRVRKSKNRLLISKSIYRDRRIWRALSWRYVQTLVVKWSKGMLRISRLYIWWPLWKSNPTRLITRNKSNTTGVTCGAANFPEYISSPPVISAVRVARSLVFCVVLCRWLFVLFLLAIVLSILLRLTTSDYLFGIGPQHVNPNPNTWTIAQTYEP